MIKLTLFQLDVTPEGVGGISPQVVAYPPHHSLMFQLVLS